ncbi:DUF3631 domain-containing protein [Actinoplanes sichuanensis]|uniref:DUF3631 domain-containing protein n=1 Tax=Actinoplanes sichuanensis TaxID=512349 RepID=A0ABW4A8S2_9ACTN|nr:DUF3631 domain-containing protein [Actinoplanes sichuanensis]BEL09193.1 DUF3631 domain-containing protein [Actinoplanes sichuanensis]
MTDSESPGADLLDEVRVAVIRYVQLPTEHVEVAITLWIAASHAVSALHTAPRLAIRSPEKRCGKSRLLDLVGALSRNAMPTANISAAVLYRVMGTDKKPTLIIDEADTVWGTKKAAEQNEDLRGLVNAGFERGRPTLRYDAAARRVEELETFGFVALAGIGALPDTITDRAVNVTMRRRRPGEHVAPFRSRRDGGPLQDLRGRVGSWIASRLGEIARTIPELPVEDRAADVWEALVIIADIAGGDWPKLAREAALALTAEQEEEERDSTTLQLLTDIREAFAAAAVGFLESKDLVNKLRGVAESPWGSEGVDLSAMKLAARVKAFGVRPVRNVTGTARGYRLEDFTDPFTRYLGSFSGGNPSEAVKASKQQLSPSDDLDGLTAQPVKASDGSDDLTTRPVNPSNAKPAVSRDSDALTGLDDPTPGTCTACGWSVDSAGHATNCAR